MELQKNFIHPLMASNGGHYYYPHFTDKDNKVQRLKVRAPRSHLKSNKAIFWAQTPIFYAIFSSNCSMLWFKEVPPTGSNIQNFMNCNRSISASTHRQVFILHCPLNY